MTDGDTPKAMGEVGAAIADGASPHSGHCDVVVIGGGPAGSTISALLCRKGWRVSLLEKDKHPRFHIGESLLPRNLPILDELGVMDEIHLIGVVKRGADFTLPGHERYIAVDFSRALDPFPPTAYQVKRAEFDEVLLRNAQRNGVSVHEGVRATAVEFLGDDRIEVIGRDSSGTAHSWTARFLVDASGRDTFLANRFGTKVRNRRHASAALFAHFEHVARREGEEAGNISMYWFKHGWFWVIPLRDGRVSVGAVCRPEYLRSRDTPAEEFFVATIRQCSPLAERMKHAVMVTETMAAGNFSYYSKRMFDKNYLLVGDAFAFIDPVFSTGVFLAMSGARSGADAIDSSLRNRALGQRLLVRHERQVATWISAYSWFIYRFTSPAMKQLFITQGNPLRIKSALLSLMSGDMRPSLARSVRIAIFKGLYYLFTVRNLRESRRWQRESRLTT
jgi:flavin-dependent dehydrogenase